MCIRDRMQADDPGGCQGFHAALLLFENILERHGPPPRCVSGAHIFYIRALEPWWKSRPLRCGRQFPLPPGKSYVCYDFALTLCKLSQPPRRVNGFAPKHSASAHIFAASAGLPGLFLSFSGLEPPEAEAFQVRRMRKKIHGRQPFQAVARLEAVRVPGQGGRVAGYIEDSLGP